VTALGLLAGSGLPSERDRRAERVVVMGSGGVGKSAPATDSPRYRQRNVDDSRMSKTRSAEHGTTRIGSYIASVRYKRLTWITDPSTRFDANDQFTYFVDRSCDET